MKILSSGLMLFLFAVGVWAQASSTHPEVSVLEHKWRIDLYNPALDKDPLAPSKQRQEDERQQESTARANENRIRQGEPALPPVVRQSSADTGGTGRLKVTYVYELKIKNTGRKEIGTLTWEYVFSEPDTTHEVGRLQFVSKVSIRPGATRHIFVHATESPSGTINAARAGKKARDQYSEQIVIRTIAYTDGSVWSSGSK
ncbi:MAG TPA: hypothetical protein VHP99_00405 [Pyrinomonadaceae bacterium]|jgi:hypothetical protein|nr:hypothetical protein [Pyrinomonadaceae bacterium]